MIKNYYLCVVLLLSITVFSQQSQSISLETVPVEKFKRVQVLRSNPNLIEKLNDLGFDLNCGATHTENYIELELSEYEIEGLDALEVEYLVTIEDLQKFYEDRFKKDYPKMLQDLQLEKSKTMQLRGISQKNEMITNIGQYYGKNEIDFTTPTNFYIPSTFGGCLTLSGVEAELDKMRQLYPHLVSVKQNISSTNQTTHEGRPIYYVKISDNPDVNEANEPHALFTGMTHSREAASLMNIIYYMWYVLENYDSDPYMKNLVDHMEMYFIPVVNPDGLRWNEVIAPNGGGLQRKNRRPNTCTTYNNVTTNNVVQGVDLNRNFIYNWGKPGASASACDHTYRGPSGQSEPETQMIADFVQQKNFKIAVNHHSFGNMIVSAINGEPTFNSGRENELGKLNYDFTHFNKYLHGPAPYILYQASGDMNDYMLGGPDDGNGSTGSGKGVLALTPEIGTSAEGGFWPTTALASICKRAMRMNLIAAMYSGKYAKLHDLTMLNVSNLTSNLTFGIERLGQTASNFTLTFTPLSSNIVSISNPPVQTGMTILEQRNITANMVLSNTIQNNDRIEFKVTLSNDDYVLYETNIVKYYNPTLVANHNPDTQNLTGWTNSGWATTSSAFSGSTAIRSHSGGAYGNNVTNTLQLNGTYNLNNAGRKVVQFYAKWDIERNFDYVQLQGSIDGTNWIPLAGKYTKPSTDNVSNTNHQSKDATSKAFQQTNAGTKQPIYDGMTNNKWVLEEFIIDSQNNTGILNASNARFRFVFRTDSTNREDSYLTTFDGFSFDDFRIINITDSRPEAYCVNKTLFLDANGTLVVTPNDIDNGSYDEGTIASSTVTPNTFDCSHLGTTQEVTLTVTDNLGNVSECTAHIFISSNQNINATSPVSIYHNRFRAIWNATCPTDNYYLDVATYPFGEESLVEWRFNANNTTATSGISANTTKTISKSSSFGTTSYVANAISSTGWNSGSGTKAWVVEFSTTGRNNITVSSVQRSSTSGPKDFKLQYRIGTGSWIDVPAGNIMCADNFTAGLLVNVPLPAACNNQSSVSLRWIMTSNTSVAGGSNIVQSAGTSRIDDIVIKGTPDFTLPSYNNIEVTGNEYLVTGLNPNTTYYYRVRGAKDAYLSSFSNTRSVTTRQSPVIWNGSTWSNGTGPTATLGAIIQGNYNTATNGSFTTNDLTIHSGVLTVSSGNASNNTGNPITVVNEIVNNGNETNFIIQNNANVIQTNNLENNAMATVTRTTSLLMRNDYVLWGSPVVGQNLFNFSPVTATNRFYIYNANTDLYNAIDPMANNFQPATGYLIRMPINHPTSPTVWNGEFKGLLNNGIYTINTQANKYFAVSNPYPSTINAIEFMDLNNITLPLYFWRKTNNASAPSYATYTRLGGTANTGGGSAIVPNGWIQTGQGFIVGASGNRLQFTNALRAVNFQNQFLRTNNTVTSSNEVSRFWLDIVGSTFSNQMLVGYHPNATSMIDYLDAVAIETNHGIFSKVAQDLLTIQSRPLPFDLNEVIPLRVKVPVAGNYEFNIPNKDGFFANGQNIYLHDLLTGEYHHISQSSVTIPLTTSDYTNRFEIKYQTPLSNPDLSTNNLSWIVNDGVLQLQSSLSNIKNIKIYDITGKILVDNFYDNFSVCYINISTFARQFMIVQVIDNQNKVQTIKIINN
ncbi:MAG: M14 family zinc carboxypeptidase [Flavobacterium sp.]